MGEKDAQEMKPSCRDTAHLSKSPSAFTRGRTTMQTPGMSHDSFLLSRSLSDGVRGACEVINMEVTSPPYELTFAANRP